MFQNFKQFVAAHKFISFIIILAVIGLIYFAYNKFTNTDGEPRYILTAVEKGTLTSSISGSGQVSATQQLDIKAKAAGEIIGIYSTQGQKVSAGTKLAQIDSREAQKSLRDAELNLETALLSLGKLKKPADKLTIVQAENALAQAKRDFEELKKPPEPLELLQAENALTQAQESKKTAEENLKTTYEDGYNAVANAFLDLPTVLTGLHNVFYTKTAQADYYNIDWYINQVTDNQTKASKYKNQFETVYNLARKSYDTNLDSYKASSRTSATDVIENLILETYETTKLVADSVKAANTFIDFVQDEMLTKGTITPAIISTHQTSLDTYTSKTNTPLANLSSSKSSIQNDKESITNTQRTISEKTEALTDLKNGATENEIKTAEEKIKEKEESLAKILAGTDELDIKSQELTIKQKENALADAKDKLADYTVRAPFSGTLAKMSVKKKDEVSSGTAVATIITDQRIAEISMNEVDVSKIKLKQKAMLTFDAVEDLTISGEVGEIDATGTVSQGVVTYGVKILFNTQDERIKPGMSVSASIITDVKQDTLYVPSSAVKNTDESYYIEKFTETIPQSNLNSQGIISASAPVKQSVEIGISNDTHTEIISGLSEGDQIITRTINGTTKATQQTAPSLFGGPPGGMRMR